MDPFVRTAFLKLMEHPEWMRVVDKEHCVEKIVRFDDGRNSPYFRVLIYLDTEERPIKKVYLYGTWVVADGDVSFVVSELSKDVFEYEVMHVHWLIKYQFEDWGVSEDGA
ncbi:hypothetical protein [Exiguobacterium sp. AM39-5BH]|uniref:hypothetical protein n=1 Tax=Exiguobacterium sp. AM39-5BH TaxID=2292355 RepID=UPI000FE2487F|nr:hypothetical protein [Exiguobacterium sp. AM39-5BH]RHB46617.1 hypothetical protein DW881_14160 [Exiguobacterium sp. AM39-5BH]